MEKKAKIYIAGHQGLVGSALVRALKAAGFERLLLRAHRELDLRQQAAVEDFFAREKPDYVFLAAAKVGGIWANNTYPAQFIYDNLMIQTNVIHQAYEHGVKKLLFLGSSCIYPKYCPQPMKEEYLLTGPLEPTNEPYAIAKIAGLKMCQAYRRQYGCRFISVMPTNLYGPGDNFDPMHSHVIPGLMYRLHWAKIQGQPQVTIWGTGKPRREFLYSDDLAAACLFLMQHYNEELPINIGVGRDITIQELTRLLAEVIGYQGDLVFDPSYPDGTPQKLLDITRLQQLGWQAKTDLHQGLRQTYAWFLQSPWARRAQ